MPRKRKQDIKINNNESLEGLCQETYNDACLQISEAQKVINELSSGAVANDVEEYTKIAKEKGNLLKVKESGIRIKLELAKLQSDILKNRGDVESTINNRSGGTASTNDFKTIREMIKNNANPISENENE